MALNKETKYKGITANYWTITEITYNKLDDTTNLRVSLFKDEQTRKLDLVENSLFFVCLSFRGLLDLPQAYEKLKTTETFKDAEDC